MGVNTTIESEILTLSATLLSRDGQQIVQGQSNASNRWCLFRPDLVFDILTDTISGPRWKAKDLGKALADQFLKDEKARELLGEIGQKRALTYGDIEAPGDAAAVKSKSASAR